MCQQEIANVLDHFVLVDVALVSRPEKADGSLQPAGEIVAGRSVVSEQGQQSIA